MKKMVSLFVLLASVGYVTAKGYVSSDNVLFQELYSYNNGKYASKEQFLVAFEEQLKKYPELIHSVNVDNNSLLMLSIQDEDLVKLLLKYGANPDQLLTYTYGSDTWTWTPKRAAEFSNSVDPLYMTMRSSDAVVKLLQDASAVK